MDYDEEHGSRSRSSADRMQSQVHQPYYPSESFYRPPLGSLLGHSTGSDLSLLTNRAINRDAFQQPAVSRNRYQCERFTIRSSFSEHEPTVSHSSHWPTHGGRYVTTATSIQQHRTDARSCPSIGYSSPNTFASFGERGFPSLIGPPPPIEVSISLKPPKKLFCPELGCHKTFHKVQNLKFHQAGAHDNQKLYKCAHPRCCCNSHISFWVRSSHSTDHPDCPENSATCTIMDSVIRIKRYWSCSLCHHHPFENLDDWGDHQEEHMTNGSKKAECSSVNIMFNLIGLYGDANVYEGIIPTWDARTYGRLRRLLEEGDYTNGPDELRTLRRRG